MGCGASSKVQPASQTYPCLRCGKDSPNGPPNQYCCVECKDGVNVGGGQPNPAPSAPSAQAVPQTVAHPQVALLGATIQGKCTRPICMKKSWNEQPGEFCSRACRSAVQNGTDPPDAAPINVPAKASDAGCAVRTVPCAKAGCGKPSWNGQPGQYCGKGCRDSDDRPARVVEIHPGDPKYDSIKSQYENKWDTNRCQATPIRAIYAVDASTAVARAFEDVTKLFGNGPVFGHGTNPGNVQRRFHGTRVKCKFDGNLCKDSGCSVCRIITDGFDMGKLGSWSGNEGFYGGGLYFTSMSSTAKGYGLASEYSFNKGNWMDPKAGNAVLVVSVACGIAENVTGTCTGAKPDEEWFKQFRSRKIDKGTGVDELVVFDSKQALVSYVIVF